MSIEVSPLLAHDTAGTLAEARGLWNEVDRPNVMIKVPGTKEGLPAIRQLLSEGINVNITLLFGLLRYREVIEAYLDDLEERAAKGSRWRVASVAGFFLSRIDVLVDPMLEKIAKRGNPRAQAAAAFKGVWRSLRPRWPIKSSWNSSPGIDLSGWPQRRRPQRLLWASTGTKNPAYSDVMYVEPLIGRDTVNTLPMETLEAYRDHGRPAATLEEGVAEAQAVLDRLPELDIDLDNVARQLEDEGVASSLSRSTS